MLFSLLTLVRVPVLIAVRIGICIGIYILALILGIGSRLGKGN